MSDFIRVLNNFSNIDIEKRHEIVQFELNFGFMDL